MAPTSARVAVSVGMTVSLFSSPFVSIRGNLCRKAQLRIEDVLPGRGLRFVLGTYFPSR